MDTLDVHTKGRKLDTLEQLKIYRHTETYKNYILNEVTQFKSDAFFEHITPHTNNIDLSIDGAVTKNKTDSAASDRFWQSL